MMPVLSAASMRRRAKSSVMLVIVTDVEGTLRMSDTVVMKDVWKPSLDNAVAAVSPVIFCQNRSCRN